MKIEINIDGQNPTIHALKKSSVLLGASIEADIQIKAKGTSRKHLQIDIIDDHIFITDLGSTNGTYLYDQQLPPGKKTEWATFIPLRLGDNVLIHYVGNDPQVSEASEVSSLPMETISDRTQVINLNELRKTKTEDLVRKKQLRRPIKSKKNELNPWLVYPIAIGIIIAAIEFAPSVPDEQSLPDKPIPNTRAKKAAVKSKIDIIPTYELKKKEAFIEAVSAMKCVTSLEKFLCNSISGMDPIKYGVVQSGSTLMVMVDAAQDFEQAKIIMDRYGYGSTTEEFNKLVAMIYLKRAIPENLDTNNILGKNLAFGFFNSKDNSNPTLEFIMTMRGESLSIIRKLLIQGHFENVHKIGPTAFTFSDQYVVIH